MKGTDFSTAPLYGILGWRGHRTSVLLLRSKRSRIWFWTNSVSKYHSLSSNRILFPISFQCTEWSEWDGKPWKVKNWLPTGKCHWLRPYMKECDRLNRWANTNPTHIIYVDALWTWSQELQVTFSMQPVDVCTDNFWVLPTSSALSHSLLCSSDLSSDAVAFWKILSLAISVLFNKPDTCPESEHSLPYVKLPTSSRALHVGIPGLRTLLAFFRTPSEFSLCLSSSKFKGVFFVSLQLCHRIFNWYRCC